MRLLNLITCVHGTPFGQSCRLCPGFARRFETNEELDVFLNLSAAVAQSSISQQHGKGRPKRRGVQ